MTSNCIGEGLMWEGLVPKSQKATQTLGSAPLKTAAIRALYMAQDAAGDPGRGNMFSRG